MQSFQLIPVAGLYTPVAGRNEVPWAVYTPVAGRNEVPWADAALRHLELTCSQGKQVLKATHSVVAQLWPEAEAPFDTSVVFIPLVLIAVLVDPGIYDFPVVAYGFP